MSIAPISNEIQSLQGMVAPTDLSRESVPDRLADYLNSVETIDQVQDERKEKPLHGYLHSAGAGALGASLGTALKLPIVYQADHRVADPSIFLPVLGTTAGIGAAAGLGLEYVRRHSMDRRERNAKSTLKKTPAWLREQMQDPEINSAVEGYRGSRLQPLRVAEGGFLLGGLTGAAIAANQVDPNLSPADKWKTVGAAGGLAGVGVAGAGALIGLLLRRRARTKLVSKLQDRLQGQAKTAIHRTIRMKVDHALRRNAPEVGAPHPGQPIRPDGNHIQQDAPERYAAGALQPEMQKTSALDAIWEKHAPASWAKTAAMSLKLRPRAEIVVAKDDGVLLQDKGDYILFPGGGIDDGEDAKAGCLRELMEEAGVKAGNVELVGMVEAEHDTEIMKGFDGERSYIFVGQDAGDDGASHPDREKFDVVPFQAAVDLLEALINDNPNAKWAIAVNTCRLQAVRRAQEMASKPLRKLADAVMLQPRTEYVAFNPQGQVLVRRGENRRLDLPTSLPEGLKAQDVPYSDNALVLPEGGVPEAGFHGYSVGLRSADVDQLEGYEGMDPQDALRELYAGMGLKANKAYLPLYRSRAQAILRLLKARKPTQAPADAPIATPPAAPVNL